MLDILAFIVGLFGVFLTSYGAALVYPPAGFITGGVHCLIWSYLVSTREARTHKKPSGAP